MSTDAGNSSAAWRSNGSYPASDDTDANTPDPKIEVPPENAGRPDVPTPEERVQEILEEYPDRVLRSVSTEHRRKLREEALYEPETVEKEVEVGEHETVRIDEEASRSARSWIDVIDRFLRDYEEYRDAYLRMARGREDKNDRETFRVNLFNSFAPEYQTQQYARLKAMKRMLVGEPARDSPTGEEYPGEFDEPVTVLFGLTESSLRGDQYAPVVDHDRDIRNGWGGADGVRRTLRYVLQDKLGLDSSDYAWWFQSEPHPGGGDAAGMSHAHPVVVFDASAADVPLEELDAETFRPVIAKHVSECEHAEWSAHRIDDTDKSAVKVKKPGEIEDFAGYVSEYLAVSPDEDLLERSAEYLMWAAAQWASTTQKYSKSRTATAAIDADKCHQQYADPDAEQATDHGERVVRSDRQNTAFECAECGSEFGVDQSPDTLVEARRTASDGGTITTDAESDETAACVSFDYPTVELVPSVTTADTADESDGKQTLCERWPSADEAAAIGEPVRTRRCDHEPGAAECPLCCADGETVDASVPIPTDATARDAPEQREVIDRVPQWSPEAVVRLRSGDETPIGEPSGVDYGEVIVEGADAIAPEKLVNPDKLRGPEPWKIVRRCDKCRERLVHRGNGPVARCECGQREPPRSIPFTEQEVRSGEVPPPELIEQQLYEIHRATADGSGGATAKEWDADWYAREHESTDAEPVTRDGPLPWEDIKKYRESNPAATVSEILEEFDVPSDRRVLVGGVIGPPTNTKPA